MSAAPVSLYLDLERGMVADLEVVARAALAFVDAIKAVAVEIDPELQVRVELVNGTDGSLSLNALIKAVNELKAKKPLLVGVAAGVMAFFGAYAGTDILDEIRDARVEITDEQAQEIAQRVATLVDQRNRKITSRVQAVYRELGKDPAITGVGASLRATRPRHIVPRSEFPIVVERPSLVLVEEIPGRLRRRSQRRMIVTIISPVLLPGDRRWRLRSFEGEFGAAIKHEAFLNDVLTGRQTIPTVEGVEMDADIEVVEEWTGEVWKHVEHFVTHVYGVTPPPEQLSLGLPTPKPKRRNGRGKKRRADEK